MFQGSPYNAYMLQLHIQVTLSKSRSEAITMSMICSLIQYNFLSVFSIVGKIILYFNTSCHIPTEFFLNGAQVPAMISKEQYIRLVKLHHLNLFQSIMIMAQTLK